jgi:hypothetical protein
MNFVRIESGYLATGVEVLTVEDSLSNTSISPLLKFETPIALTLPVSANFSIALHVSRNPVSPLIILPSLSRGNLSGPRLNVHG